MKNLVKLVLLTIGIVIANSGHAQLTGEWKDDNGACYKIRQIDNRIYWSMDGSPRVINVFTGYIAGNYITGTWADVPGGDLQNSGTLSLRIDNNNQMTVIGQSRTYGGSVLTRGSCCAGGLSGPQSYSGDHTHIGCDHIQSFCKNYPNHPVRFESLCQGKVTGTFGTKGTSFEGTLKGTVLKFTYNAGSQGSGTFNFSPDFKSFTGTFEDSSGHRGTWSGTRN